MICHVGFEEIVPVRALNLLERTISKAYALTRMRISPRYELEGLTESYLRTLRDRLCMDTPSACGLLADSKWKTEDGELHISMSEAAREYLKLSLHSMTDRIRTETGLDVPVVAVPFDDRTAKEVIEAQRRAQGSARAGSKGMSGFRTGRQTEKAKSQAERRKSLVPASQGGKGCG